MEEITVTGCWKCPLYAQYMVGDDLNHACYHPSNPKTWDEPFKSCPLKEKSLTIKLANEQKDI